MSTIWANSPPRLLAVIRTSSSTGIVIQRRQSNTQLCNVLPPAMQGTVLVMQAIPDNVDSVFASYPAAIQTRLAALRDLILTTADETEGVGPIEEALKWGQPSYLTATTGSGSTIRIAPAPKGSGHDYAMYFICSTNLVESFKSLFSDMFTYDSNRALLFKLDEQPPVNELRECVAMALTYHLSKK